MHDRTSAVRKLVGPLQSDNPGVEVTLLEAVPDRLCELLVKGEMDVALMARPDSFPAPLQASKLYSERFVIACSASHSFASKNEVSMAELDGEFYLSRINCEFCRVLDEMCRKQGVNLVKWYRSEREDWILTMIAAGMGVCFLPEYTATFPGVISLPGRIAFGRAQRLPDHRCRPSLVITGCGLRAGSAALPLAVGFGRPQSARNSAGIRRRLTGLHSRRYVGSLLAQ